MEYRKKGSRMKCLSISWLCILSVFYVQLQEIGACSMRNVGQNFGQKAAAELAAATKQSSAEISRAIQASTKSLQLSLQQASEDLRITGENLAGSVDKASAELGHSIRQMSDDLVIIADKVTHSIDKGVEEMSVAVHEAIDLARGMSANLTNSMDKAIEVAGRFTKSVDKAVAEIGRQIENAVGKAQKIVETLTKSLDDAVKELGTTLRYVADKFVEISKQFNMRIDSGDLIEVSSEMKEALVKSVSELTRNWKVAVNTADLKDVGATAAAELSTALQNIKGHLTVRMEIDGNTREAIRDISIAVGFAFSVLFVALVIAMQSCRSCVVQTVVAIGQQCAACRESRRNDEENQTGGVEMKTVKRIKKTVGCKSKNKTKEGVDSEDEQSSTGYETDDLNSPKKAFDKRMTLSYSSCKEGMVKKNVGKFERISNKGKKIETQQTSSGQKLLSPD